MRRENVVRLSDKTLIIFHPKIDLDDWNNILISRLGAKEVSKDEFHEKREPI